MPIKWIEANLPFSSPGDSWFWDELSARGIQPPDLADEVREEFGTTKSELTDNFLNQFNAMDQVRYLTLRDEVEDEGEFSLATPEKAELFDQEVERRFLKWIEDNPEFQEAWHARRLMRKIQDWKDQHPKTAEYKERYSALLEEENQMTFQGRGLANPGVMIEMEDGSRYLIGSNSALDGEEFEGTDIVVRYAVLVEWPVEEN